jgi:hypothetical protein
MYRYSGDGCFFGFDFTFARGILEKETAEFGVAV